MGRAISKSAPAHCLIVLATATLAASIAGCASTRPLAETYAGPVPRPAAFKARFAYPPLAGVASEELVASHDGYRIVRLELSEPDDRSAPGDDPVEIEYYELDAPDPRPVALVLPILAGQNRVARQFAGYFARRGLAAVVVYSRQKDNLLADLGDPEAAIRRTVARHRQVLDWVGTREELDAERVGVFGASLGGFNALFLAAADPRIRATVPALAGGDLPRVLVSSEEAKIERNVDEFKGQRGWTDDQMESYLRRRIVSDPLWLAPYVDARTTLMIMARYDDAVPFINQLQLRQALGNPRAIMLASGHVSALLYLPYLKWKVFEFFREQLHVG